MRPQLYLGIAAATLGTVATMALSWKAWHVLLPAHQLPSQPNVILILLDTTRPDHLGCYGYSRGTSPNLDRLAARGVRFAKAHCQAPWTLPSHMSLFTSLIPSHHQVNQLSGVLSPTLPTLAEILQKHGYHTAGLVNDGMMKSTWGFQRGFSDWVEFANDTPEGDCAHITEQALQWLDAAPPQPFFLFLHYYDPHAPYDPPEEFRRRFGSALSGTETKRLVHHHRAPQVPIGDADLLKQLIGSYDGEIAWLDQELGRLIDRVPDNTLLVVFSDHGEAFKEHGWTSHGATLFEEEIHVVLLMRLPGPVAEGLVVDDPVMLLDVAPTILSLCGVQAPDHYEGRDLAPTWAKEGRLAERPILSETKAQFDGEAAKMVALNDWKLIRSVLDGREELYRLPDEKTDLSRKETSVRDTLSALARRWVAEEDFWIIHARGLGECVANLVPRSGQFINVIPFGDSFLTDVNGIDPNGRSFQWSCTPGTTRTRSLFLQVASAEDGPIHFDLRIDGRRVTDQVFIGPKGFHPMKMPFDLQLDGADISDPVIDRPFQADKPGFYLFRHRVKTAARKSPAVTGNLDDETIRQLRSLGYLR